METFMDTLWEHIAAAFLNCGHSLFSLLQNLHFLGPAVVIGVLALATVGLTKALNRLIITRRYRELEQDFQHWKSLREEAMQWEDGEKGRRMARNIDQAGLNRAYYDYFFEGLLLGIARKVIPIFFMFAFINEFYRPDAMAQMFGREYVLQIPANGTDPLLIGAVFWFFLCLLGGYLAWSVTAGWLRRRRKRLSQPSLGGEMPEAVVQ